MEESEFLRQWKERIQTLRASGVDLFPNDFRADIYLGGDYRAVR